MTMGLLVHRSFVVCVPLLLYSNDIRIKHGIESKKSFCGVGVDLQGPVNFVTLRCVTPVLRPLSMAMSTVVIHVFGDVPSAPIVGAFQVSCMWPSSSSQCQPCYIDQIENILNFLCTETNSCTLLGLVCIGALVRLFQKLKYRNTKWSHRAELVGSKA
jgi:hypothetical protein